MDQIRFKAWICSGTIQWWEQMYLAISGNGEYIDAVGKIYGGKKFGHLDLASKYNQGR